MKNHNRSRGSKGSTIAKEGSDDYYRIDSDGELVK